MMLIPTGTSAELLMDDDSSQPVAALNIRATEYTVGEGGDEAMPGLLPPTSGYTYAVEFSADEAFAPGVEQVTFDPPLISYVDNFLGFPAGTPVPTGYYDGQSAAWIASEDGRVIEILSVNGGEAQIDTTGDGLADDGVGIGMTPEERQQLAASYPVGASLWRSRIPHFSPWDKNWGFGPPVDAVAPPPAPPYTSQNYEFGMCTVGGSRIDVQNQDLGETIPIAGTRYSLNYQSSRTRGFVADQELNVTVSDSTVPASLKGIDLTVDIAGNRYAYSYDPLPSQSKTILWNGLDPYGRRVNGSVPSKVSVAYGYDGVYGFSTEFARSFGATGSVRIDGSRTRREVTLIRDHEPIWLGGWKAESLGLGGWTLDIHHSYDTQAKVLYLGDGRKRSAESMGAIVHRVGGRIDDGYGGLGCPYLDPDEEIEDPECGDGGLATEAGFPQVRK
ncbi:MAG: hypothetical protein JJ992_19160, partial [Planctomycetes bacterium]|nr:hypothetical protein [Planctomycetota bacterium]